MMPCVRPLVFKHSMASLVSHHAHGACGPVLCRWEKFTAAVERSRTSEAVATLFPFKEFFADAPQVGADL